MYIYTHLKRKYDILSHISAILLQFIWQFSDIIVFLQAKSE